MNMSFIKLYRPVNTIIRSKYLPAIYSPTDILQHEGYQKAFQMDYNKSMKNVFKSEYQDEGLFEGISEKVKSLFTLQHATLSEISESAVRMIAEAAEVQYSPKSDSLEMKVIRSQVLLYQSQSLYRLTSRQYKQRYNFHVEKHWKNRNEQLEILRSNKFETYVKIMKVLDIKLEFQPEIIVPKSELSTKVKEMKIRSLAHLLKTEDVNKKRMELFNKTKDKFKKQILAESSDVIKK